MVLGTVFHENKHYVVLLSYLTNRRLPLFLAVQELFLETQIEKY